MNNKLLFLTNLFCLIILTSVLGCASKDEQVQVPDSVTVGIEKQNSHADKVLLQQEIIRRQEQEIQKQDRELEDLERQKIYNDSLRRFEERSN